MPRSTGWKEPTSRKHGVGGTGIKSQLKAGHLMKSPLTAPGLHAVPQRSFLLSRSPVFDQSVLFLKFPSYLSVSGKLSCISQDLDQALSPLGGRTKPSR